MNIKVNDTVRVTKLTHHVDYELGLALGDTAKVLKVVFDGKQDGYVVLLSEESNFRGTAGKEYFLDADQVELVAGE